MECLKGQRFQFLGMFQWFYEKANFGCKGKFWLNFGQNLPFHRTLSKKPKFAFSLKAGWYICAIFKGVLTLFLGVDRPCIVWQPKRKHRQVFLPVTWPNHLAVPWFFPELRKPFASQLYTVVGGGIWKSKEPMRYLQQNIVTRHINCCIQHVKYLWNCF